MLKHTMTVLDNNTGELVSKDFVEVPSKKIGLAKGLMYVYPQAFKLPPSAMQILFKIVEVASNERTRTVKWSIVNKKLLFTMSQRTIDNNKKILIDSNAINMTDRFFVEVNPFVMLRKADYGDQIADQIDWDKRKERRINEL